MSICVTKRHTLLQTSEITREKKNFIAIVEEVSPLKHIDVIQPLKASKVRFTIFMKIHLISKGWAKSKVLKGQKHS